MPILGTMAVFAFVVVLAVSLPCIMAGYGLLKGRAWALVVGIVISAVNLLGLLTGEPGAPPSPGDLVRRTTRDSVEAYLTG